MDYTEVIISIRRLVRAIDLDSKRSEKETGLSIPQLLALMFMSKQDDYQSSQLELRKYLHLNSSTVTGIVSRLVAKGYIARLPSKEDKRATRLTLTQEGVEVLDASSPILHEKLSKKLSGLSTEQLESIQSSLSQLIALLEADDIDASAVITSSSQIS